MCFKVSKVGVVDFAFRDKYAYMFEWGSITIIMHRYKSESTMKKKTK